MKYLIKPTKNGWYISINSTWDYWSIRSGWFTPLELMWCFDVWKHINPRYFLVNILGLALEVGKFEEKDKAG